MAFTQTDLENIEAAIVEVAKTGVAEIEINGERTKYQDLNTLYALRDRIKGELSISESGSTFIKVGFVDVD